MRRFALIALLSGCTLLTSPGDYEGGDADGGATSCTGDGDCPVGLCDTGLGICVDCLRDDDCSGAEECRGGVCGPASCGGVMCTVDAPLCRTTDDSCVECLSASDCGASEACTPDGTCESCNPPMACAADEACVFDPGGDFCEDCDGDDDGLIRRDPRCDALAGDRDCDDDGDGFCVPGPECAGECAEVAFDCDDTDPTVRPVVLSCTTPGVTTCSEPGDLLPGTGIESMSVFALGAHPEPLAPDVRTPMSVVPNESSGFVDVVYLVGTGPLTYSDRLRRMLDLEGRDTREVGLPATDLSDFTDLRAKVDVAGTIVGALGVDSGSMAIEAVLVDGFEGATIGSAIRYTDADAVPPIDVSVETVGASTVPYVVWPAEKGESYDLRMGSDGSLNSKMMAAGAGSLMVSTARGLVSASTREDSDSFYWDPRDVFELRESRDAGGAAALVTGLASVGFDALFVDEELLARSITFTGSGFLSNAPVAIPMADLDSRVALAAYNNIGFIVFDAPAPDGGRRLFASRLSLVEDSTMATTPVALTGEGAPDFETLHGLELTARTTSGIIELSALVHGTLRGTDGPALYLFASRRCDG